VSGNLTTNATGSSPQGQVSLSGSAHIDTSKCSNYPISGSVSVTDGGLSKTITFTDRCDGSFTYDGPALNYVDFEPSWSSASCGGSAETTVYHFVVDGGRFLPDAYCPTSYFHNATFTGSLTGTAMHIEVWQRNSNGKLWVHATFAGSNTPQHPSAYVGTMSWQVTNYNGDGSVRCTDSGTQSFYEMLLASSFCQWMYSSSVQPGAR
ncbi:MAG TPA: hypothetical protein VLW17_12740, partial [Thermoanaerobaculaceae bacterium]|nr:hypothetical protein [Thermoanaerobaculaceae bacterium]